MGGIDLGVIVTLVLLAAASLGAWQRGRTKALEGRCTELQEALEFERQQRALEAVECKQRIDGLEGEVRALASGIVQDVAAQAASAASEQVASASQAMLQVLGDYLKENR